MVLGPRHQLRNPFCSSVSWVLLIGMLFTKYVVDLRNSQYQVLYFRFFLKHLFKNGEKES